MHAQPALQTAGRALRAARSFFVDSAPMLAAFAWSRLLIIGVILLSKLVIVPGPFGRGAGLLQTLTNWDGGYYLHIAQHGYFYPPGVSATVVFFPVYPFIVRSFAFFVGDFRVAAVVAANLCLLIAAVLFERLVRSDYGPVVSRTAGTFLLFNPVTFFFSSAYTESTFLLFAVAAFFAATKRHWVIACVCGMILSATRNIGLLIAVPLLIEHLRQTWSRAAPFASLFHRRVLLIAMVPTGLAIYMLYAYFRVHDALAFAHQQAHWGREAASPLRTLAHATSVEPFYRWLFLGSLCAALLLWIGGILFKLRVSYLVWTAMLITTYLSSYSLEALPRFLSVLFPLFAVLALTATKFPASYQPLMASSVALLTLCTILFANGYWMT